MAARTRAAATVVKVDAPVAPGVPPPAAPQTLAAGLEVTVVLAVCRTD